MTVNETPQTAVEPPTVGLSATTEVTALGTVVRLNWTSDNANVCFANGDWSGSRATSGSEQFGPLTADASFGLRCEGAGGTTADLLVLAIDVPAPTVELRASAADILAGQSITLEWDSEFADRCGASGGWAGALPTNGSRTVVPQQLGSPFTITCFGPSGSAGDQVAIDVRQADGSELAAVLNALEWSVAPGGFVELAWDSRAAESCAASGDWSGTKVVSGSERVGPIQRDMSFTLTCSGPDGEVQTGTSVQLLAARLGWSRPTQKTDGTPLDDLAGYVLHYGTTTSTRPTEIVISDPTQTEIMVTLAPGDYYFYITATTAAGLVSSRSNEVTHSIAQSGSFQLAGP